MAAAPPGRFAGCRDLVGMLERLPDELDAAIMEHAGGLTQFLHGRLPQPMTRETAILLWIEAIIADNVDALTLLPRGINVDVVFLAQSTSTLEALGLRRRHDGTFRDRLAGRLDWLFEAVEAVLKACPKAGRLLLSFFLRQCPDWRDDLNQLALVALSAAAADDVLLFAEIMHIMLGSNHTRLLKGNLGDFMASAAHLGGRNIMRMLINQGIPMYLSVGPAVLENDSEMLKMIVALTSPQIIDSSDVITALTLDSYFVRSVLVHCVASGKLDVLRMIAPSEEGLVRSLYEGLSFAVQGGLLQTVQRAYTFAGMESIDYHAFELAIVHGWVDLVHWMIDGPPKASSTEEPRAAGLSRSTAMVDMLIRVRGDATAGDILSSAAQRGNLAIVMHLHKRGFKSSFAMDQAAGAGHLEVLEFLHHNRAEGCTTAAMDRAAENGHVGVLEFLHKHRTEGCTAAALQGAARGGHAAAVRFLLDNRSECDVKAAMDSADCSRGFEIVRMLHERVEPGTCQCELLSQAVASRNAALAKMLLELGHHISNEAVSKVSASCSIEIAQLIAPRLQVAQWKLLYSATQNEGRRKFLAWVNANSPVREERQEKSSNPRNSTHSATRGRANKRGRQNK
nr:hypothetical protein HK105_001583 [Polyrhizophydium stewartii]